MKYLFLFLPLVFFSCDIEDDIQLVKGDYILQSYTKVECDGLKNDLTWKGTKSIDDEFTVSGSLDITIFSIFTQELVLHHNATSLSFDIKFAGAFTHVEGEEWIAEFSDSPFSDGDCEEADVTVEGNIMTWRFIDSGDCEIVIVWEKE